MDACFPNKDLHAEEARKEGGDVFCGNAAMRNICWMANDVWVCLSTFVCFSTLRMRHVRQLRRVLL